MKKKPPQPKRPIVVIVVLCIVVGFGLWHYRDYFTKAKEIPADALVVDVRTPGEFAGGHYEGALNIPVSQIGGRLGELGAKDRNIIVYCRSGSRSRTAKSILDRAGFTNVEDGGSFSSMRRRKRAQRRPPPEQPPVQPPKRP